MINSQPKLNSALLLLPNLTFAQIEVNTSLAQVDEINYKPAPTLINERAMYKSMA